ncbi:hypothetical protein ABTN46_19590, partial [Acinetobacter baumannii]
MYRQWLECLAQAGFPNDAEFHIRIPEGSLQASGITPEDAGHYIHVSPCTTDDARQLPVAQMIGLLEGLQARLPQHRLVLSAMKTD